MHKTFPSPMMASKPKSRDRVSSCFLKCPFKESRDLWDRVGNHPQSVTKKRTSNFGFQWVPEIWDLFADSQGKTLYSLPKVKEMLAKHADVNTTAYQV